ncbi:hypothetical protein MKW92_000015 [Papaver armeniacum]|nr:hypothetical protein MKW92_000015 [Papaver armeniacum]
MKVPYCSVCQNRYNEDNRVPLLLQCGHGFCKDCLSKMFSASPDTNLSCPRCRHISCVGNSVNALRKNFAVLALIHSSTNSSSNNNNNSNSYFTDDDDDEDDDDDDDDDDEDNEAGGDKFEEEFDFDFRRRCCVNSNSSSSNNSDSLNQNSLGRNRGSGNNNNSSSSSIRGGGGSLIDLSSHHNLKFVKKLGDEIRVGIETWGAVLSGTSSSNGGKCKHQVAVKKVILEDETDLVWVQNQLENLRRSSMWCRNVCTFHGATKIDGRLCLVMDRYSGSVLSEMRHNEGRLTLEQILRYGADIARGVAELHAAGVVCMNLKPSNLLLDVNGRAVVSDYGLPAILKKPCRKARLVPEDDSSRTHSCMDCTMLNPHYAAPEAWEPVKKALFWDDAIGISTESDAWSFGCTLVEMWSGLSSEEIYRAVVKAKRLPPQYASVVGVGIPTELWKMIGDCLQYKASKRPTFHAMLTIFLRHLQEIPRSAPASPDKNLLSKAASGKSGSSIGSLLEAQNADGQTALHLACRRGSVELVEAILEYEEADVDVLDKDGDPPIVFALAAGSPECVRTLIRRAANVSSMLRRVSVQQLLMSVHTMANRIACKPLHMCIATWNVAIVKRWVEIASQEEIADAIDIPSEVGTALCMAASLKKDHETEGRELVRILLAAGADPTAQDPQHRRTALHTAAMANDVELVKICLDAGVDVNIENVHSTIPLHVALARGAKLCVGLLLSAGANCNLQDDEGDTAFHIAADSAKMIRENLEWIAVMLQYPSAAIDVRNHRQVPARDWISEDLMEALINNGIHLSPTIFEVGDWVKFKRSVKVPKYGWQGAKHKSVGFVQNVQDKDNLIVSFCSGEARVLASDVIKVIPLDRGQHVQLKQDVKEPRYGWRGQSRDSIGTVLCVDDDGILRVGFPGASRGWKADPAEMERVEEYKVGDWVRIRPSLTTAKHGLGAVTPGSIGIVYCIRPDNSLLLELSYLPNPWHCEPEEVESVIPFRIGDQVCVKRSVAEPRYAWGGETHHSVGRISEIGTDGLLIIEIPNRPVPWQADPSDMEKVEDFKVGDWVRVKTSVSSPKYGWEDVTRNSIGIIHSLEEDGDMGVAFCFRSKPFSCSVTDMEKVPPFEVGQEIHVMSSVAQPRLGWSNETAATIGKIARIDMDGKLNVRVTGRVDLWKVAPGDAERLSGFDVGDWVRLKPSMGTRGNYDWNNIGKENLAVVHSVQDTGYLELACCFHVEKVVPLKMGQHVRFRPGLTEPRWGWRGANIASRGIITGVHADGEVRVVFFGLSGLWKGDPADLQIEEIFEVGEWVRIRDGSSGWKSLMPGSIGIVQGIGYEGDEWDGTVQVGFCGEQERWVGPSSELERVERLVIGQRVKVRFAVKQPRFGWSGHNHTSIGTISSIDADGKLRIYTPVGSKAWMLDPAEIEIVEEEELQIGDWVKVKPSVVTPSHQWGEVSHEKLWVAFCFLDRLWVCKINEMERVRPFMVGDKVKIRGGLVTPSKGEVAGVDANGKLRIRFQWREGKSWIGDPADIVLDE